MTPDPWPIRLTKPFLIYVILPGAMLAGLTCLVLMLTLMAHLLAGGAPCNTFP